MSLMRLLTSGKTLVGLQEARPRYRMTDPRALPKFGSGKNPFRGSQKTEPVQKGAQQSEPVQMEAQALIVEVAQREQESPLARPSPTGRGGIEANPFVNPGQNDRSQPVREGKVVEAAGTLDAVVRVERDGQRQDFAGTGRPRPVTDVTEDGSLSTSFVKSATQDSPPISSSEGDNEKPQLVRPARGASWLSDWAKRLGSVVTIRPRRARSAPRPQQGELSLSLDQVTVMRNDLSDSDLEIVPARREDRRQKTEIRDQKSEIRSQETEVRSQKGKAFGEEVKEEVNVGPVTAWGRATRQLFGVGKT